MAPSPRRVPKDGSNPFAPGLDRLGAATRSEEQRSAVLAAGLELVIASKLMLSKPGTGRDYPRKGGKVHKASAPGQPPAVDRGELRNSIGEAFVGDVLRVGSGLEKAPLLEFGTISLEGFIAPRPFMRPALTEAKPRMGAVMASELNQNVRKKL